MPTLPTGLIEVELTSSRRGVGATAAVGGSETDIAGAAPWSAALAPTGNAGEVLAVAGNEVSWTVGIGGGSATEWRTGAAAFVRTVNGNLATAHTAGRRVSTSAQVLLPADVEADALHAFTLGTVLGGYRYTMRTKPAPVLTTVRLVVGEVTEELQAAVTSATRYARATALARDLASAPSNVKNPPWMAEQAQRILGAERGLNVQVRDEKWLADKGFGGTLAVGGGSATPPRLIEMTWRPRGAGGPHLVLVGKGITFDTGGISLKPAQDMHWMRTDMAGGAAVIGAMLAIAQAGVALRVTALVPAAENHISGSAYRPGDVVRHYGGITTEVANTDAEGRMVLADALAYGARVHKADMLLDAATLTGAMKMSLGVRTCGFFATDDAMADGLIAAGDAVGEQFWRMPFLDADEINVHGELGDVKQAPGGPGGIAAAMFLREFTAELPWLHLDIAGPARAADKMFAENGLGPTGFAARTMARFAADLAG